MSELVEKVEENPNNDLPQFHPHLAKRQYLKNNRFANIPLKTRAIIFLGGYFGLKVASVVVQIVLLLLQGAPQTEAALLNFSTALNALTYIIVFIGLAYLLWEYRKTLFTQLKSSQTWLRGIGFGLLIMSVTAAYGIISTFIVPDMSDNLNQQVVESIITYNPFVSFATIALLGPIVEEFIYRVGLFALLREKDRHVAFIASAIIFGFIHFNMPATDGLDGVVDILVRGDWSGDFAASLVNELVNIPSYILSGLLFCIAYDQEGLGVPMVAHIFNNLTSFILILVA